VLLFKYSALTFNGHRIHYDRRYVTTEEGYPGLVVHGPLIATLLADLARDRVAPSELAAFSFRAVAPLFDVAPFTACGRREADGGVRGQSGCCAPKAKVAAIVAVAPAPVKEPVSAGCCGS